MKSNIREFSSAKPFDRSLLEETEKCAVYNGLDRRSALRLTLLTEELLRMLPNIGESYTGRFWLENEGTAYELHAVIDMAVRSAGARKTLLKFSDSGENAAAKGVVGKIRAAVEKLMLEEDPDAAWASAGMLYMDVDPADQDGNAYSWSLEKYMTYDFADEEAKKEVWDELEKSVVARLADDVTVGVRGKKAEITIKKKF